MVRIGVRNPKVLDLSPKPKLQLLWTQRGPSRGWCPCHQPDTGTLWVTSIGLLSPGWPWSCPGTRQPWGQGDTVGQAPGTPRWLIAMGGHGGTER